MLCLGLLEAFRPDMLGHWEPAGWVQGRECRHWMGHRLQQEGLL